MRRPCDTGAHHPDPEGVAVRAIKEIRRQRAILAAASRHGEVQGVAGAGCNTKAGLVPLSAARAVARAGLLVEVEKKIFRPVETAETDEELRPSLTITPARPTDPEEPVVTRGGEGRPSSGRAKSSNPMLVACAEHGYQVRVTRK